MARQTTSRRKPSAAEEAQPAEPSAAQGSAQDPEELRRRIERRAYELWEQEGRPSGTHDDHWRRAEQEIMAETRGVGTSPQSQPTMGGSEEPAATAKPARSGARRTAESGEASSKAPRRRRPSE